MPVDPFITRMIAQDIIYFFGLNPFHLLIYTYVAIILLYILCVIITPCTKVNKKYEKKKHKNMKKKRKS